MPPQHPIRRRDSGDLPQGRTAQAVRSGGQSAAIVVGKTQAMSTKLTPQKPVLFHEVRDGFALAAIEPAGQHTEYHLERREVDHEPELIS